MQDFIINSTVQYTLLLFIPLLFAFILKMTNIRAWAMLGGVIGGVLLGPAIFGSVAPAYWEDIFQGGSAAHEQVMQLDFAWLTKNLQHNIYYVLIVVQFANFHFLDFDK